MLRKLIVLFCVVIVPSLVFASRAKNIRRTFMLTSGTQVKAFLVGDEFFSCYRTVDGKMVAGKEGAYYLIDMPQAATVKRNMLARRHVIAQKDPKIFRGSQRGLVILVDFPDKAFSMDEPAKLYNRILNEHGFHEYGAQGSVHDYFFDQSNGMFDLHFDVVGPYRMSHDIRFYGERDDSALGRRNDVNAVGMVQEAIEQADKDIDFSKYDWDHDGEVDQVFVLYAGYGEASGGPSYTIWAHEWTLEDAGATAIEKDGVTINTYACSQELNGGEGAELNGIGTFCHEFSHCMGLPDMYDTNYKAFGMGNWDIMDSGNYNGGNQSGWCPAGYTAYEKNYCGWLDYEDLNQLGTMETVYQEVIQLKSVAEGGKAYRIYNPNRAREYYILENRSSKGWDSALPGNGLLVMHVDYMPNPWQRNQVNTSENHQRMTIIPADNEAIGVLSTNDFEERKQRMSGDPYPYMDNDSLTDLSLPRDEIYNRNIDGSNLLHISLTNIKRNTDGTVSFVFGKKATLAVEGIAAEAAHVVESIYTLDGKRVTKHEEALPAGIYIKVYADGTHRKVVVSRP